MPDCLSGILNKKAGEAAAERCLLAYDPLVECIPCSF